MPKLIKLNKFGTLAVTIPKSVVQSTGLVVGDSIQIEVKNINPLILALKKNEEIKW